VEQYVDVPVERVVERVRPVENIVERTVDVSVDRIVEKVRPVENVVEQYVDVPVERVVERVRPVEFLTERYSETEGHTRLAAAAGVGILTGSRAKPDADDLKIVEGIGPKIEKLFHAKGVYTFEQLAACTPDWIREMLREAGPAYAIHDPATWPKQGRMAAAGDWAGLEKWQKELISGRKA
jgi:predicted flap endonuclease-1-like 5' DNA nuclease